MIVWLSGVGTERCETRVTAGAPGLGHSGGHTVEEAGAEVSETVG